MIQTDIAIIGAGPGGYIAALRARQLGARRHRKSGSACVPQLGLHPHQGALTQRRSARVARGAHRFGVRTGE